jgi:arylsulfatase
LPLDDRRFERFNPLIAGRPDLMFGRKTLTAHEGMTGMMENAFINIKNASHTITAEVEIPKEGGKGVILCQGGRFAGWSLYMKDGKVSYAYNWFDVERSMFTAKEPVPPGKATIRFEFTYEGGNKPGAGGTGTLYVNDKKVAGGRLEQTVPFMFSGDETADVGIDDATPVTEDYAAGHASRFNGRIRRITIEVK